MLKWVFRIKLLHKHPVYLSTYDQSGINWHGWSNDWGPVFLPDPVPRPFTSGQVKIVSEMLVTLSSKHVVVHLCSRNTGYRVSHAYKIKVTVLYILTQFPKRNNQRSDMPCPMQSRSCYKLWGFKTLSTRQRVQLAKMQCGWQCICPFIQLPKQHFLHKPEVYCNVSLKSRAYSTIC